MTVPGPGLPRLTVPRLTVPDRTERDDLAVFVGRAVRLEPTW